MNNRMKIIFFLEEDDFDFINVFVLLYSPLPFFFNDQLPCLCY